ncbi:MAG: hypothetical protein ACHQ0J_01300 [Candidatus Dormibacterales bacterium]
MSWVTMRAVGTSRAARRGPGVTPTLYAEMSLLRNSLLNAMREEAPVNKNPQAKNRGALRASLRAGPWETDGVHWRSVFTAAEYIKYVIKDTKPHRISAKPGGVLAFNWSGIGGLSANFMGVSHQSTGGAFGRLGRRGGPALHSAPAGIVSLKGGMFFLRFVKHPGTKANNFVERALARTLVAGIPGFTQRVQQAMDDDIIQLIQGVQS